MSEEKTALEQTLSDIINGKTIEVISDDFPSDWLIIVYDIPIDQYRSGFYKAVNFTLRRLMRSERVQQSVWAVPKTAPLVLKRGELSKRCFINLKQINSEIIKHGGLSFVFEAKKIDVQKIMDKGFKNRMEEYQKIIEEAEQLIPTYENISDLLDALRNVDSRLWYKPYVERIEGLRKKAIDNVSKLLQKMKEAEP